MGAGGKSPSAAALRSGRRGGFISSLPARERSLPDSPAIRPGRAPGTFWVQDPRALHRGTPNTSDRPRPELVICYSLSWFRISRPVEIHRESFEQLDARGKELFSRAEVL